MFLCKQAVYTSSRVDRGMLHDKPAHTDTNTSFPSVASPSWLVQRQSGKETEEEERVSDDSHVSHKSGV